MSLPSVEWRYVGSSYASGTVDVLMDTIFTMATGTGYIDGSPRSQGSGSAGTWSKATGAGGLTEAIYVTPPSGNAKIIIAGSSGTPSPSPTMASPDTYGVNTLMMNITKNAGAFTTWNSGNPFTSGTTFGYWRILGSRTANTGITNFTGNIYLYESKESVGVFFITTGANTSVSYSNGGIAGALWDPESSSSSDAESDGRTYGMITSGHYNSSLTASTDWDDENLWGLDHFTGSNATASTSTTKGFFHGHASLAGGSHCGIFTPGSSGIKYSMIMMYPINTNSGSALKTPSGKYARIPLVYRFQDTLDMLGRLREISLVNRGLIGQRHTSGSSTVGYTVGCSDAALNPGDCLLFEY